MKEHPMDQELKSLMQGALVPMETKLQRDLWPQVSARLGERQRRQISVRLKWWEWALVTGDLGAAFYAPDAIPALLYHL